MSAKKMAGPQCLHEEEPRGADMRSFTVRGCRATVGGAKCSVFCKRPERTNRPSGRVGRPRLPSLWAPVEHEDVLPGSWATAADAIAHAPPTYRFSLSRGRPIVNQHTGTAVATSLSCAHG